MLKLIKNNPYPDKVGFVAQYNAFELGTEAQLEADRKAILDNVLNGIWYLKDGYCLVTLYITPEEYQQLIGE